MGTILSTAAALLALGAAACGPDDPDTAAPVNGLGAASTETKTLASGTKNEVVGVAVRGVEDPRAFVVEEYAAIARDPSADRDLVFAYSDRLRALFEAYHAWTATQDGLIGALDFDWWTNSQDWVLSGLRVTEANDGPDRRIVSADFINGDRPDQIRFLFVRQSGRWFLDDAVEGTGGGGEGWTLSDLLRERPE